jgi:hypothetical protein
MTDAGIGAAGPVRDPAETPGPVLTWRALRRPST